MTLGVADNQGDLFDDVARFFDKALPELSIYSLLRRERDQLFPDDTFADLFDDRGRRSVPPSVVAVVMVLQRLEGLSDREAVERYCFDTRWRYAAGLGGYDTGWTSFSHTVLVDMRERLRNSERPRPNLRGCARCGQRRRAGQQKARPRLHALVRRGGDHGHGDSHPLGDPGTLERGRRRVRR